MFNKTNTNVSEDWQGFITLALSEEPYSSQVIFSIALFIVFIASLIGNSLTCIVIYSDKSMHTATNCYLFNLAVSDLLVTFPILIIIYQVLTQDSELVQYKYGVWACKFVVCIHFIFINILLNNGIMVMTALSIERYIAICYPMMLKGTPVWRRVGKIIAIIWTVAIFETLPEFSTIDVFDTGKTLICFSLPTPFARYISIAMAVVTFVIPLSIMTFVYTMIAFKIKENNQKCNMKDTAVNNGYKRKKVNKLIALTVSFVICWLPFFLIRTLVFAVDITMYSNFTNLHRWWATAHKIAMFNSWFTTVLNPLLFSVMSTKFRKALKELWNKKLRKRDAENGETTHTQHKSVTSNRFE